MSTLAVNRYHPRQFSADEMSVVVRALRDAISYRGNFETIFNKHGETQRAKVHTGRARSYHRLLRKVRGAK